jgi:hypothetical protein
MSLNANWWISRNLIALSRILNKWISLREKTVWAKSACSPGIYGISPIVFRPKYGGEVEKPQASRGIVILLPVLALFKFARHELKLPFARFSEVLCLICKWRVGGGWGQSEHAMSSTPLRSFYRCSMDSKRPSHYLRNSVLRGGNTDKGTNIPAQVNAGWNDVL